MVTSAIGRDFLVFIQLVNVLDEYHDLDAAFPSLDDSSVRHPGKHARLCASAEEQPALFIPLLSDMLQ